MSGCISKNNDNGQYENVKESHAFDGDATTPVIAVIGQPEKGIPVGPVEPVVGLPSGQACNLTRRKALYDYISNKNKQIESSGAYKDFSDPVPGQTRVYLGQIDLIKAGTTGDKNAPLCEEVLTDLPKGLNETIVINSDVSGQEKSYESVKPAQQFTIPGQDNNSNRIALRDYITRKYKLDENTISCESGQIATNFNSIADEAKTVGDETVLEGNRFGLVYGADSVMTDHKSVVDTAKDTSNLSVVRKISDLIRQQLQNPSKDCDDIKKEINDIITSAVKGVFDEKTVEKIICLTVKTISDMVKYHNNNNKVN